jgi:L-alanine-DL-glutamate epimerase-like enolase superfamily enzyme
MKITAIECHVLLDPNYNVGSTSSAQDDIIVEIHTDEGISGIGESDVNPWIARACIEAPGTHTMGQGLTEMLIGRDPLAVEELWERLYTGSAMNGRRGALVHALGALDIALHDLRGKIAGRPCHAFLGSSARGAVVPYASLQPEVSSFAVYEESLLEWALRAKARGFRAAKLEVTPCGPYAHHGLQATYAQMTELIGKIRAAVGDDFTLMVDTQYAFPDVRTCLDVIRDWIPFRLFFIETPLASDDLEGYARLAGEQSIPIAAGEWLSTRFEFADLITRGKVQVVQPDIGRVGGLTEARRVCEQAREAGRTVVPHLWKTGISIAAAVHLAAVTPHCAFIEYLPADLCESRLRKELADGVPEMVDGVIAVPSAPGLGVRLNREALRAFQVPC